MSSVSASQVPGLVTDAGYAVMVEKYDAVPQVRGLIFETMPCMGYEYGWTEKALVGDNVPSEIGYSEAAPMRTFDEGYQWLARMRKLSEAISIPEELMRSPNASAAIAAMVGSAASKFGEGFAIKKERMAADFFNKGGFTAGHVPTFSGSYEGHTDANPAFIFDGKPFFARTGNNHPIKLDSSVTKFNAGTDSLSSSNLALARIAMEDTNAVDSAGNKVQIVGDTLLVPVALSDSARVIINSELLPGTAQNDTNYLRGAYNVVTWRYLTTATMWAVGAARKGLRQYDSGAPMIQVSAPDPSTGDITVRFVSYWAGAVTDWRYWYGNNVPTS